MDGDELIKLIGKPISDLSVQKMFKHYGYQEPKKFGYCANIFEEELSIGFLSKCKFEKQYLDPPYEFKDVEYIMPPFENPNLPHLEYVISEICFTNKFKNDLPFNLKWDDTIEKFKKIGQANGKDKNSEGTKIWYFLKDKYRILIAINKTNKLEWLTVWLIENNIKKSLKLKETIKKQNILFENHFLVSEFQNKKPTICWHDKMLEGEIFYTKESIDETDKILTKFIDNLIIATKEQKANKILSSVKKVVLALNKLENKYSHIETNEREELCTFILNVLEITGFKCDWDITEEWRNW